MDEQEGGEQVDERASEGDEAYRQREHDHLVEPMFEALQPGVEPRIDGRPARTRWMRWMRWSAILAVAALAAAVWAALRA